MPEVTPKLAKQHAVPQHIAAFEFKLVGDLTLRQFLLASVGVAVAYAAWISHLNPIVKWLVVSLAAVFGLGTAFVPLEDRTLDQWLLNFLVALLSPTQRVWRKEPLPPGYLRENYSQFLAAQVLSLTPARSRPHLEKYLAGFAEKKSKVERAEEDFIRKLNFNVPLPPTVKATPKVKTAPPPQISLKNITPGRKIHLPEVPKVAGTIEIPLEKIEEKKTVTALGEGAQIKELERLNRELLERLGLADAQLKSLSELKEELYSKSEAYRLRLLEQELLVQKLTEAQEKAAREISEIRGVAPKIKKAIPLIPLPGKGIPNVVSGTVKDREGRLLENVVVIVKSEDGEPVRALKTNELGQFAISTPLENGRYTAEVSGKGRRFDIIEIKAEGSPLPPLEFRERYG